MRRMPCGLLVALLTAGLLVLNVGTLACSAAKPEVSAAEPDGAATIVSPTRAARTEDPPKLSDGEKGKEIIRSKSLPYLVINRKDKTVTIDGFVCLREGFLELFACGNRIREHEAIVSLKARPLHINVALMLLGAKPGNPVTVARDGTFLPPAGPVFRVFVEYDKDGETVRKEAHEWMDDADTEEMAKPQKWVFSGSQMNNGLFGADYEGTVVCVSNFAAAILDLPYESSDKNSELLFMARTKDIPELGTKVKLILQATGEVIKGKKLAWTLVIEKNGSMTLEDAASSLADLKTKLEGRDKFLRTVHVLAHPDSKVSLSLQAMRIISGFGLQPQLTELAAIAPEPAGGGSAKSPKR
ncbi:MAG: hypothetical protein GWP05_03670 [Anaerolineaceae bacterium]|nr:hypothetical protein [Anaerolineaceae bacterium]